jgi:hypothetical protein
MLTGETAAIILLRPLLVKEILTKLRERVSQLPSDLGSDPCTGSYSGNLHRRLRTERSAQTIIDPKLKLAVLAP